MAKRRVVIHSDNTGSEAACKKGTARSWDHAQLVHAQWLHAAILGINMHVIRVATDDNIADLPSRKVKHRYTSRKVSRVKRHTTTCVQEFEIFENAGAFFTPPKLDSMYAAPAAWETLQERWALN